MPFIFQNNAETTLVASLTSSATSLPFTSLGGGGLFNGAAPDNQAITFSDSAGTIFEVAYITASSVSDYTLQRGAEGSAQTWPIGTIVSARVTAGILNSFLQNNGDPGASGALAIGTGATSVATEAVALGTGATAVATEAVALGAGVYGELPKSLATEMAAAKRIHPVFPNAPQPPANLESVLWTVPFDLTGGPAWAAATAVKHGRVRRPTTPNGCQYLREDTYFTRAMSMDPTTYTSPVATGATEPVWPTANDGTIADGVGGNWFCLRNDGYPTALPQAFFVEEIGILVLEATSVTVQPYVSIGSSASPTLFVNNQQTASLDAQYKAQVWRLTNPQAVTDLNVKIDTLATGTTLLVQVFFKGFYAKHWLV